MWKFALQSKDGGREKFEIENTAAFMLLRLKVFELTNIPPDKQILKTGRPPKEINVEDENTQIKDIGSQLQNMDLIIADIITPIENNLPPSKKMKPSELIVDGSNVDQDALIAASLQFADEAAPDSSKSNNSSKSNSQYTFSFKIEPQSTSPYDGKIGRKVIPSDNSCLFASVAHCLKPSFLKYNKILNAMDLRYVCSDYVKAESQITSNSDLIQALLPFPELTIPDTSLVSFFGIMSLVTAAKTTRPS